jgi:TRAP-type mannitol/chloroaromatic compound transport system permease small subunit
VPRQAPTDSGLGRSVLRHLLPLCGLIDKISRFFGIIAAVMVVASCLISAGNALSRYALDISSNAWLEIQWQMFAAIFLLGAPWVLKVNEHVRVDVIYGGVSPRTKLWIDVFGFVVFLMPAVLLMIWFAIPWWEISFVQGETSANAGGLPVWPVKFLLPLGFVLLLLQGVAELIRRIAALQGLAEIDTSYAKPLQ